MYMEARTGINTFDRNPIPVPIQNSVSFLNTSILFPASIRSNGAFVNLVSMNEVPLNEELGCKPSICRNCKRSLFNVAFAALAASRAPAAGDGGGVARNCEKGVFRVRKIVTGLSGALASWALVVVSLRAYMVLREMKGR